MTLAERKVELRERIALHRLEGAVALEGVRRPFVFIDAGWRTWRRLPPLARNVAAPGLVILLRRFFPRASVALRWLPTIRSLWRTFSGRRRTPSPDSVSGSV